MAYYGHEVETIEISQDDFDYLRELQEQNPPFRFSCNQWEVWIAVKIGYDHPEGRDPYYVDHHILDRIAQLVRRKDRRGKQFRVRRAGAFICDGDEPVAEFKFVD